MPSRKSSIRFKGPPVPVPAPRAPLLQRLEYASNFHDRRRSILASLDNLAQIAPPSLGLRGLSRRLPAFRGIAFRPSFDWNDASRRLLDIRARSSELYQHYNWIRIMRGLSESERRAGELENARETEKSIAAMERQFPPELQERLAAELKTTIKQLANDYPGMFKRIAFNLKKNRFRRPSQ